MKSGVENMNQERILDRKQQTYAFTKMHGCGNDYIYFNCFEKEIANPSELSVKISDRHFGIGADGIILICKSDRADAKMKMFNADGSEGMMCGNGIRCVGKYLIDNGLVANDQLTIETLSGIKHLKVCENDSKIGLVTVNMGKASFATKDANVDLDLDETVGYPVFVCGKTYEINCVSMGNPHCVIFVDDVDNIDLEKIGPAFEKHRLFKDGINTEFVEIIDEKTFKMRVWERGSAETLACGTGACAVASIAVKKGVSKKNEDLKIKLKGGSLVIRYTDEAVYMTGPAEKVFEGKFSI